MSRPISRWSDSFWLFGLVAKLTFVVHRSLQVHSHENRRLKLIEVCKFVTEQRMIEINRSLQIRQSHYVRSPPKSANSSPNNGWLTSIEVCKFVANSSMLFVVHRSLQIHPQTTGDWSQSWSSSRSQVKTRLRSTNFCRFVLKQQIFENNRNLQVRCQTIDLCLDSQQNVTGSNELSMSHTWRAWRTAPNSFLASVCSSSPDGLAAVADQSLNVGYKTDVCCQLISARWSPNR